MAGPPSLSEWENFQSGHFGKPASSGDAKHWIEENPTFSLCLNMSGKKRAVARQQLAGEEHEQAASEVR